MAITDIKIDIIEPFAEQQTFGAASSYERVKGIEKGCAAGARSPLLRLPNSGRCGPNGCPYRSSEGIGPKGLFNQRETFTYDLRSILTVTSEQ